MTDKINQAIEEVRSAGAALKDATRIRIGLEDALARTVKECSEAQEVLRVAESKLRGAIFEETQG